MNLSSNVFDHFAIESEVNHDFGKSGEVEIIHWGNRIAKNVDVLSNLLWSGESEFVNFVDKADEEQICVFSELVFVY